jgi:hypothetical protein
MVSQPLGRLPSTYSPKGWTDESDPVSVRVGALEPLPELMPRVAGGR